MSVAQHLEHLAGTSELQEAARELANRLRKRIFGENLFDCSPDQSAARTDLRQLREFAKHCGVRDISFGAPVLDCGRLVPLSDGGFRAEIADPPSAARARFSLAHELGHTHFYDLSAVPHKRLQVALTTPRGVDEGTAPGRDPEEAFWG